MASEKLTRQLLIEHEAQLRYDALLEELMSDPTTKGPFVRLVAYTLAHPPSAASVQAFANRYPDRYAACLATLAKLAGLHREDLVSINVSIGQMSDADIMQRIRTIDASMDLAAQDAAQPAPALPSPDTLPHAEQAPRRQ